MDKIINKLMKQHLQLAITKYGLEGALEAIERRREDKIKNIYLEMFWKRITKQEV